MRVEGYTKKDGTVVQGYDTSRTKKAEDAPSGIGEHEREAIENSEKRTASSYIERFSAPLAAYVSAIKKKELANPTEGMSTDEMASRFKAAKVSYNKVVSEVTSRAEGETAVQYDNRLRKMYELSRQMLSAEGDRTTKNIITRFRWVLDARIREINEIAKKEKIEALEAKKRSEGDATYRSHYAAAEISLNDADEDNPVGNAVSSAIGSAKSDREKAIAVDAAVDAVREAYPEMSDLEIADLFCKYDLSEEGIHAYISDSEMMEGFDLSVLELISLAQAAESSWRGDHVLAGFSLDEDGADSRVLKDVVSRQEDMGLNLKGEELSAGVQTANGSPYEPESEPSIDEFMRNQYPEGGTWGESGFLMSDGTLLDMSHGSGTRADDHRSIIPSEAAVERWGWTKGDREYSRWELLVQTLRRAGAMRIDGQSGLVHTENELTAAQERSIIDYVRDFNPDYVSIRVGDGSVDSRRDIEIHNPNSGQIIRAINLAYEEGRSEAKSMIRKGMVSGYTKKDGTVVKPYQTSRTKKAEEATSGRSRTRQDQPTSPKPAAPVEYSAQSLSTELESLMSAKGISPETKYTRSSGYKNLPPAEKIASIAAEQRANGGKPTKEALASYESLKTEIGEQFESILAAGLKIQAWKGEGEPYSAAPDKPWVPSSKRMREEVTATGLFKFFMTEKGFGSGAEQDRNHPLLQESPYLTTDGEPMLWNDVFRVVHDAVAHLYGGFSFSTRGEMNGMLSHASTLSRESFAALFAETFAQNSVYETTGKFADQNIYVSKHVGLIDELMAEKIAKSMAAEEEDSDEPLGAGRKRRRRGVAGSPETEVEMTPIKKGYVQSYVKQDGTRVAGYHTARTAAAKTSATARQHPISGQEAFSLSRRINTDNGFTYQPVSKTSPTSGFSIAMFPESERILLGPDEATPGALYIFVKTNLEKFKTDNRIHFGAWHNEPSEGNEGADNKVYLDTSIVIENLEQATELAKEHCQLAIFDLSEGREVQIMTQEERDECRRAKEARTPQAKSLSRRIERKEGAGNRRHGEDVYPHSRHRTFAGGNRRTASDAGRRRLAKRYIKPYVKEDGTQVSGYHTSREAAAEEMKQVRLPVSEEPSKASGIKFLEGERVSASGEFTAAGEPKSSVRDVARYVMDSHGRKINTRFQRVKKGKEVSSKLSPEDAEYIVSALVDDAMYALKNRDAEHAALWYEKVGEIWEALETKLPDLKNPEDRFFFSAGLTLLSNGQDIDTNMRDAVALYLYWKEHKEWPFHHDFGKQTSQFKKTAMLFEKIVDKMGGWEPASELLAKKVPVSEIHELGFEILPEDSKRKYSDKTGNEVKGDSALEVKGELVDEVVPVFSVFGPKLGSFYNNLNGNTDTITMDLWFMRTIGRITGELMDLSPQAFDNRIKRAGKLFNQTATDEELMGFDRQALKKNLQEVKERGKFTDQDLIYEWAKARERVYAESTASDKISYADNSEINKAAAQLKQTVTDLTMASPFGGNHRRLLRQIMHKTLEEVQARSRDEGFELGENLTPAGLQAVLWFHEKKIYDRLGNPQPGDGYAEKDNYKNSAERFLTGQIDEIEIKWKEKKNKTKAYIPQIKNRLQGRTLSTKNSKSGLRALPSKTSMRSPTRSLISLAAIRKAWVKPYTKADGTKVAGYHTTRTKKVDSPSDKPVVSGPAVSKAEIAIPQDARIVAAALATPLHGSGGHGRGQVYAVGGSVRDHLFGKEPKDFDLATNLPEDEIIRRLEGAGLSVAEKSSDTFGVVFVSVEGYDEPIEVAPFRSDDGVADGRRPDSVSFGVPIEEDAKRRDFTMNALYYDFGFGDYGDGSVIDFGSGIDDIKKGVVRPVGLASERFREDRFRILRLMRFFSRYNDGDITEFLKDDEGNPNETWVAIQKYGDLVNEVDGLSPISGERIQGEFLNGLKQSISTEQYLKNYASLGLLASVFPRMEVDEQAINDIGESNNAHAIMAWMLKGNENVNKKLNALKYPNRDSESVQLLIDAMNMTPDGIYSFMRRKSSNPEISASVNRDLMALAVIVADDPEMSDKLSHLAGYEMQFSSGRELMAEGYRGKEIGIEQKKRAIDHYKDSFVAKSFTLVPSGESISSLISLHKSIAPLCRNEDASRFMSEIEGAMYELNSSEAKSYLDSLNTQFWIA